MAGSRLRVVLIDSGVDPGHPGVVVHGRLSPGARITAAGEVVAEARPRDDLGHGTAVAATILSHTGPCEIVPVRVFAGEPECTALQLVAALRLAASRAPAIVNVSLGLLDVAAAGDLEASIAELRARHCRVVAPATASGIPCLPGVLHAVDAVVADPNQPRGTPRRQRHGDREVWFASPEPPPDLPGLPPGIVRGDSLAVAEVTAWLVAGG